MRMKNHAKKIFAKSMAFIMAAAFTMSTAAIPVSAASTSEAVDYSATSGAKRNVMYYGDWSIYESGGYFFPSGIPADQLTHLNFAFLDFDASGNLAFTDKDAATGVPAGMTGVQWNSANSGLLSAMQDLRANNPNLRIGVSIGGWSKSGDFSPMAANTTARAKFISNVCKFVKYTNMDFVDLDWEYPGAVRAADKVDNINDEGTPNSTAADKANFITLLRELKAALNAQGTEVGKVYELSVALPATKNQLDTGVDIRQLFQIVDFANIMTYDMRGAWDDISGHQTGLYTNPNDPYASSDLSIDGSVRYLLANGGIANKIVVGCAFYTRGWEKVADNGGVPGLPGLFGTATKVNKDADYGLSYGALNEAPIKSGDGGRAGGVWAYGSQDKLKAKYTGLVEYWDDAAKAPYLYNASTGAFFTYDNVRSVTAKTEYVKAKNLGGTISWMASEDKATSTSKRDELTKALKQGLFGSAALPKYNISKAAIDVSVTVKTYTESNASGYEITLKNNAVKNESAEVLSLVESAAETVKLPKLYIKSGSGATFSTGGYGSGTVTNTGGYCVVDLSAVYDNQTIPQGGTVTFKLKVTGTANVNDIQSIEISQRIIPTGLEISRQAIYGGTTNVDQKPVITGADNKTIQVGTAFDPLYGVTATDNEDGDLTAQMVVTGTNFDTSVAGEYTLTYTVTDSAGQVTTVTRIITVSGTPVNTPPVISGATNKTINVGDNFNALEGVSASDAEDGAITVINVTGSVNTAAAGTYTLTYSVTDSAGATTTATRVITVKAVDDGSYPAYDPTKVYTIERVEYGGEIYEALWWTQGGGTPDVNPAWKKITNNSGNIEYNAAKEYQKDDQVTYNGQTYKAQWWTKGDTPGSNAVWQLVQ